MIEKNYQPAEIEGRISRAWEDAGTFKAGRAERKDAKPFTIVIPDASPVGGVVESLEFMFLASIDADWRPPRLVRLPL